MKNFTEKSTSLRIRLILTFGFFMIGILSAADASAAPMQILDLPAENISAITIDVSPSSTILSRVGSVQGAEVAAELRTGVPDRVPLFRGAERGLVDILALGNVAESSAEVLRLSDPIPFATHAEKLGAEAERSALPVPSNVDTGAEILRLPAEVGVQEWG